MKRKITPNQFENMITECVGQVLAESQQLQKKQNKRIQMNEAQIQNYVRNIINEELENERLMDYLRGAGEKTLQSIGSGVSNLGRNISNGTSKVGNKIATRAQNFAKGVVGTAKGAYGKARQFAQDINQAGNNASFVGETQKLAQEVQQIYQKYGNNLSKWHNTCLKNAYNALNSLIQSCQNGEMNA